MNQPPGDRSRDQPERQTPRPGFAGRHSIVAAVFDERNEAEVALSELERGGIPPDKIGLAYPAGDRKLAAGGGRGNRNIIPAPPTTGFPGWTMAMAPWVLSGVAPLVVQGSLSLAGRKNRPDDLRALASSLGLREEATEQLRLAFEHRGILVTVEADDKEIIATHILERNGGHPLPRQTS